MESKTNEDLTTRTANLKRQLMEKLQSSRSTSTPPSAADAAVDLVKDMTTTGPQQIRSATSQQHLHATESDLNSFIADISSAILANQKGRSEVLKPAANSPVPATLEDRLVYVARPQAPSLQTMPFPTSSESLQSSSPHMAPGGSRPTASRSERVPDAKPPPLRRSTNVAENGSPSLTNHTSGTFVGLPPSVAHHGLPEASLSVAAAGLAATRSECHSDAHLGASLRLSPEELNDVSDWLVHTNFYDAGYRQRYLSRRRRLAELEEERLKLLREVEEESNHYGRRPFPVGGVVATESRVSSPTMGPPPAPVYTATTVSAPAPPSVAPTFDLKPALPFPNAAPRHDTPPGAVPSLMETAHPERRFMLQQVDGPGAVPSAKRTHPETENPNTQNGHQERPRKMIRREDAAGESGGLRSEATNQVTEVPALAPVPEPVSAPVPAPVSAPVPAPVSAPVPAPVSAPVPAPAYEAGNAKGAGEDKEPRSSSARAPESRSTSSIPASRGAEGEPICAEPAAESANGHQKPYPRDDDVNSPQGPSTHASRRLRSKPVRDKVKDEQAELERLGTLPDYSTSKATNFFPVARADQLDLGQEGDTRFYMIKSVTDKNVDQAMKYGVWTTSKRNGDVLRDAFRSCRNVLLFFSVNKSRAFQGYARMTTEPSTDIPTPEWMRNVKWAVSPPFRIEWLSTCPMSYHHAQSLLNFYNEDRPVSAATDGQEIDDECGRGLVRALERSKTIRESRRAGSPKSKPSSNYTPKKAGSAKKNQAADRSWSRPYYADQ